MGGGGGGDNGAQAARDREFWAQEHQQELAIAASAQESADAVKQQLAGTQLDWLRQYGQTSAMKQAGIPAPFSTMGGGFTTQLLDTAGNPLPLDKSLSTLGKPVPALAGLRG
jgi:hypothetical protein